MFETSGNVENINDDKTEMWSPSLQSNTDDFHKSTLSARKHPTRTTLTRNFVKRSEMESDEDKEDDETIGKRSRATRTRKLSFAPEKVIDYKPQFRPIRK